jgi:hypothetical protein
MTKVIKREYFDALCQLAFNRKESSYIRSKAFQQMFITNAKNELTVVNHQELVEKTKNLPVSTVKQMVALAYTAILKKLGRDDSHTISLFKTALNNLSEHELRLEWQAIADGTVSSIVETMLTWDQQSERTQKDIVQIFEGLAVPYFRDYKGKVPKEDLEFAHQLVKDYFQNLKSDKAHRPEKQSLPEGKKGLPAGKKSLPRPV